LDENIEDPASLKAIFLDLTENHTAFADMLSRGKRDHVQNARARSGCRPATEAAEHCKVDIDVKWVLRSQVGKQ
jgi:hypothetical protein